MISYNKRAVTALLLSERKTMKSKVLAILTLIFALCICTAYADGVNVDSGIKYVSQSGATIRAFPDVSGADYTMYASANIKNESGSAKDMIMFASIYDGSNNLKKVIYEKISVPEYDEKTIKMPITIPQGTSQSDYVCKAFLWDSVIGEIAYRTESVFLDFGTSLYGITIDGADIENYSDATDFYSVQISKANSEIKVYPKSGATNIQYSEVNVPGTSKVLLASGNNKREITIKTYLDDSDTYTLSSLKYKIGNTEYAIEGFDSEVYEYTVNLPDNTFYVALLPEAMGEITCTIQDINDSPNIINGVSFGKMRTDTTGPAYVYERKMIDGIVPIKNECTKAIVNVTDGENTAEYVINFKAVQPRLTEYNLVGADGDSYVPVFTSGAGLNNDNGTICAADRVWAAANISKKLVGASYFMSPYNNKGDGQWWNSAAKGEEYFNFTADTAGTIYFMGSAALSEYGDWECVNSGIAPTHPTDYSLGDKTWNNYSTEYFVSGVKWNDNAGRCNVCGVGEVGSEMKTYIDGTVQYKYVFAKHFEAGEKVSVPHSGLYGNSAAEIIWAIVWDVDVNYPGADVEGDDEPTEGNGPIIILKLDDLCTDNVDGFQKAFEILQSYGISNAGFGVIGEHLENSRVTNELIDGIKRWNNAGIEIWHHGYSHTESEYSTSDYNAQKQSFGRTCELLKEKTGVTITSFGSPFNNANETTVEMITENFPQIKCLMLVNATVPDDMVNIRARANFETAVGVVNYNTFVSNYESKLGEKVVIMQGHAGPWDDNSREEFKKILTYLKARNATFMTPTQYADYVTGGDSGDDEIEEGLILDLQAQNNTGEGILDEFTTEWLDLSKNGNNVQMTEACEWGSDALWIKNGSKKEAQAVLLGSNVNSVINSYNFTLEFDVADIEEGSVVAASKNEEFSLCEEKGKLAFYFAGIVRNTISVALEDVIAGHNQITVSCDSSNNVTIKWYIDGVQKGEKSVKLSNLKTVDAMMLGSYNRLYSGYVGIKSFRIFDYTKNITE